MTWRPIGIPFWETTTPEPKMGSAGQKLQIFHQKSLWTPMSQLIPVCSVSNFCYQHQNLSHSKKLSLPKLTTRIHAFWPCLKLHNWCFWSTSTLLSFCAPYRCKHKCLWGICCYSDMEHIHGRQARRSFCSRYRCKHNSPIFTGRLFTGIMLLKVAQPLFKSRKFPK